jgi:hypothetical protein
MRKIKCHCLFDITATGVTGHQRQIGYPFTTKKGQVITDQQQLTLARNQQRNWDTLLQLIGLRTQIFETSNPEIIKNNNIFSNAPDTARVWSFNFEIEPQAQWLVDNDEFWVLKHDSEHTPMILGLNETVLLEPWITALGTNINIIYHAQETK